LIAKIPRDLANGLTVQAKKNKPRIWYVPGSGGMWINYLMWCVQNRTTGSGAFDHFEFPDLEQRIPHYQSLLIFLEHTDDPSTADIVLGSNRAWMNFYLNLIKKKNLAQDCQGVSRFMQDLQAQDIKFNLDWCDIWDNPVWFMQQLSLLTGLDLPYNYVVQEVTAQYSRSCVWMDPQKLINNRHLLLPQHQRLAAASIRNSYFYPQVMTDPTQSGNYCPLIFSGTYVEKLNNDQVRLSACCINHTGPAESKVDFEHSSYLVQQRELTRRGLPVPGCMHCYHAKTNLQSVAIADLYDRPIDHAQPVLQKLDYNVDPICNAKCIQCSSYYSSAWLAEDQQWGQTPSPEADRSFGLTRKGRPWQELDLSNLERLYFNGGEPLLSSEPLEILQHLAQLGQLPQLRLSLNTNGSIRPNQQLMSYWKKCDGGVVNFSIDGTGAAFEYIRYPLDWQQVEDNILWLMQQAPKLDISIAFTLGIHNIDIVDQTQAWVDTINQNLSRKIQFRQHLSSGPLDITGAEPELKTIWLQRYSGNQPWHKMVRTALQGPASAQPVTWIEHLTMIDQRRQTDWRLALPALHEAWKLSQGSV
jgi:hypothetical protein